jgi:hypothetical protein
MTINTKQELGYALGMMERRVELASNIGKSLSKQDAIIVHRSVCGAVKEVRKHHKNILSHIDDEGAGHARQSKALLDTAEEWLQMSRLSLASWGVGDSATNEIEKGVGI